MPASQIMGKYRAGTLHSGRPNGPIVTNPHQARAIQLSYLRKEGKIDSPPQKKKSGIHKLAARYRGR